jgi:hypothetical protein
LGNSNTFLEKVGVHCDTVLLGNDHPVISC